MSYVCTSRSICSSGCDCGCARERVQRYLAYIIFGHDRHLSNSRFWQCQRLFDYVEAFALFSKNSFIYIFCIFYFYFCILFLFCLHFVFILVRFGLKRPAWSHCRRRHHHFLCGNCHQLPFALLFILKLPLNRRRGRAGEGIRIIANYQRFTLTFYAFLMTSPFGEPNSRSLSPVLSLFYCASSSSSCSFFILHILPQKERNFNCLLHAVTTVA